MLFSLVLSPIIIIKVEV